MADGKIEYQVRADTSNVGSDLENVGSEMESHGSKWSSIMDGVGKKIGGTLVDMAAQGVKAAWDLGTGFEDGLAKVSTLMNTTVVDMGNVSSGLLDLSAKYGLSATQMTEAAYNAVSSYTAFATDVDGLNKVLDASAKLAAAGFTDIDTASSATLKTMNAYGLGLESVDMIQKVLIQTQNNGITTVGELGAVLSNVTPTAAAMGVSFEQVGAALATMTAQGTPAAQATTQLNSLFAELGKEGTTASKALAEATEGTKYAGMGFTEMMAAGVPLNEVLQLMRDKADADGVSMLNMFSSVEAGKAALSMTGEAAQTFTNNLDAMSTEADVVDDSFKKVSETSSAQLARTMAELQAVLINLFNAFSPIIKVVLDIASTIVQAIGSALTPFMQAIQPIIDIVVKLGQIFGQVFGQVISGVLTTAATFIKGIVDGIQNGFNAFIQWITGPFVEFWKNAWDSVVNIFKPIIDLITSTITNAVEMWRGIFTGIVDFIKGVFTGNWSQAWQGVVGVFKSIIDGIVGFFKTPINFVIDGINKFLEGINKIEIPDWVPLVGGMGFHIPTIPRLKVGMDYVPNDDFPAILHKGEAVLTAGEAANWRGGAGRGGFGSDGDMEKLAAMIANEMSRVQIPVYLDGREVGRGVEPYVSDRQARRIESRQRSGWNGRV